MLLGNKGNRLVEKYFSPSAFQFLYLYIPNIKLKLNYNQIDLYLRLNIIKSEFQKKLKNKLK